MPTEYIMFIDDERFPPNDGQVWKVCRSMAQVDQTIDTFGFPNFISFDHDLGDGQPTGMDIARWLIECDMDTLGLPRDFKFYVHSQNPIGKRNIEMLLNQYLNYRAELVDKTTN